MNKTKFNIDWSLVGIIVVVSLLIIAAGSLLIVWALQTSEQEIENNNTYARCKSAGGEMGYSKCFKNGKEI